ncbi:MAG: hypothetical protein A2381_16885 [Bdellovibrionales bacterium RIFOXYB1_FULL_37_110]|nr:MAG: hypothetical protein A2181_07890 [Bdellovibrionales bacterium RIFOXYA1_FULL_38_20]OFZ50074.1 MAG: hypothetical protein A2417_18720 [Bdellovibrionales bacterium RIFOXYC1_FULL_37_79]OFZ59980.1 MAG: hypothetical protein A2381_16885 [Bdellovibrionales bacterium RIFOXYB1_FULL_37_110]OFZ63951.1 MAG: hypothetical protein A2577_06075 [Bdellovibrionales bacterium RIFOXYD1_FULL_36_51]
MSLYVTVFVSFLFFFQGRGLLGSDQLPLELMKPVTEVLKQAEYLGSGWNEKYLKNEKINELIFQQIKSHHSPVMETKENLPPPRFPHDEIAEGKIKEDLQKVFKEEKFLKSLKAEIAKKPTFKVEEIAPASDDCDCKKEEKDCKIATGNAEKLAQETKKAVLESLHDPEVIKAISNKAHHEIDHPKKRKLDKEDDEDDEDNKKDDRDKKRRLTKKSSMDNEMEHSFDLNNRDDQGRFDRRQKRNHSFMNNGDFKNMSSSGSFGGSENFNISGQFNEFGENSWVFPSNAVQNNWGENQSWQRPYGRSFMMPMRPSSSRFNSYFYNNVSGNGTANDFRMPSRFGEMSTTGQIPNYGMPTNGHLMYNDWGNYGF